MKYQMAGLARGRTVVFSVAREPRKTACLSGLMTGQTSSVEVANDPQAYMIGKKCLEAGLSPAPSDITNPDFVLKSLLS